MMSTIFFWASKLISPFIAPLGAALLASGLLLWFSRPRKKQKYPGVSDALAGIGGTRDSGLPRGAENPAILHKPSRTRIWAAGLGLWLLVWIFSSPGFSQAMVSWWEYPLSPEDPGSLRASQDAIVVLGGSVIPDPVIPGQDASASSHAGPQLPVQLNRSAERLLEAARLWKGGVAPLVIVSGGSGDLYNPDAREAPVMAALLGDLGVPTRAIIQENTSRNTRENLVNVRALLEERGIKRIMIVSSGLHLPRVDLIARKVLGESGRDFQWRLWSCDTDAFQTGFPEAILPSAFALEDSTRVLREAWGTLAYRLMGYL